MITERNTSFFEKLFFSNDGVGWISECPRKASNSVPQAQVVLEAKRIRREPQGSEDGMQEVDSWRFGSLAPNANGKQSVSPQVKVFRWQIVQKTLTTLFKGRGNRSSTLSLKPRVKCLSNKLTLPVLGSKVSLRGNLPTSTTSGIWPAGGNSLSKGSPSLACKMYLVQQQPSSQV